MAKSKDLDQKWLELVAAGRSEWSPGMLGPDGFRVLTVRQDSRGFQVVSRGCGWTAPSLQSDFVPDWSDDATIGALLGQVRARCMDPTIYARPHQDGWQLFNTLGPLDPRGRPRSASSEAGALLCGMELAP